MLKINIIAVGSIKEKYLNEAINEYQKRLSRFCKVQVIEIAEQSNIPLQKKIEAESDAIKNCLKGYVFLLDRQGQQVSSEELAKNISDIKLQSSEISFIIGGSNGVSEDLKKASNKVISFGKITYPHQLFRVILFEQIYRAFTIIEGLPYHK